MINAINHFTWSDFLNAIQNLIEINNFRYAKSLLFFTARTQFISFWEIFMRWMFLLYFTLFCLDNSVEKENHSIKSDKNLMWKNCSQEILEIVLNFMAQGLFIWTFNTVACLETKEIQLENVNLMW